MSYVSVMRIAAFWVFNGPIALMDRIYFYYHYKYYLLVKLVTPKIRYCNETIEVFNEKV